MKQTDQPKEHVSSAILNTGRPGTQETGMAQKFNASTMKEKNAEKVQIRNFSLDEYV